MHSLLKRSKDSLEGGHYVIEVVHTDSSEALIFQQFYIEAYPSGTQDTAHSEECDNGSVFNVRMFGRTRDGLSICCNVRNLQFATYIELPTYFTKQHCESLQYSVNQMIALENRDEDDKPGVMVEFLGTPPSGTADCEFKIAKLTSKTCRYSNLGKKLGGIVPGYGKLKFLELSTTKLMVTVFRMEFNVAAFCWIEIPSGEYTVISDLDAGGCKSSTCQIEVDVFPDKFTAHELSGSWVDIVPFKILSFDIECLPRPGVFPVPTVDSVIQISNTTIRHSDPEPDEKRLFTLKTCSPIKGAVVTCYESESEMLEAWTRYVLESDPDMITGYNVLNFDLRYLLQRFETLKLHDLSASLGRVKGRPSTWHPATVQHRLTPRQYVTFNVPGRLIFDVYLAISADPAYHRMEYKLSDVSLEILGVGKTGVHHTEISKLQLGDETSRKKLGEYCLQDSLLPVLILRETGLILKCINRARRTGLQFHDVSRCEHDDDIDLFCLTSDLRPCREIPNVSSDINEEGNKDSPNNLKPENKENENANVKRRRLGMRLKKSLGDPQTPDTSSSTRRSSTGNKDFNLPKIHDQLPTKMTNTKKTLGMRRTL